MIRPLPESLFHSFEVKLENQDFQFTSEMTPSKMVQHFEDTLKTLVSETFPERKIIVKSDDRPYFTENLRKLKRMRQRHYHKHGRSKLKANFEEKLNTEKRKYIEKISLEVSDGKGEIHTLLCDQVMDLYCLT